MGPRPGDREPGGIIPDTTAVRSGEALPRRAVLAMLATPALLTLPACGDTTTAEGDGVASAALAPPTTPELEVIPALLPTRPPVVGTRWVVDAVVINGEAIPMPDGIEAYLRFNSRTMSGWTGCNAVTAQISHHDGDILFKNMIASTRPCPPELRVLEPAILKVLDSVASWQVEGEQQLILTRRSAEDPAGLKALNGLLLSASR